MAMTRHPITGVAINEIDVEKTSLDFDDAVTAWVMKLQGEKYAVIAHKLGTNTIRLGEVFRGERHPEAKAEAERLLGL